MSRETIRASCTCGGQLDVRRDGARLEYGEAVLEVARLIPAGCVLTYGDVAELLEAGGPRQVGTAMSRGGDDVPWWRVLRAGGLPPRNLAERALEHYLREGTPLRHAVRASARTVRRPPQRPGDVFSVDLALARWTPAETGSETVEDVRKRLRGAPDDRCGGLWNGTVGAK